MNILWIYYIILYYIYSLHHRPLARFCNLVDVGDLPVSRLSWSNCSNTACFISFLSSSIRCLAAFLSESAKAFLKTLAAGLEVRTSCAALPCSLPCSCNFYPALSNLSHQQPCQPISIRTDLQIVAVIFGLGFGIIETILPFLWWYHRDHAKLKSTHVLN